MSRNPTDPLYRAKIDGTGHSDRELRGRGSQPTIAPPEPSASCSARQFPTQGSSDEEQQETTPLPSIVVALPSGVESSDRCVFGCSVPQDLRRISREHCVQLSINNNNAVFVYGRVRACSAHYLNGIPRAPNNWQPHHTQTSLTAGDIQTLIETNNRMYQQSFQS